MAINGISGSTNSYSGYYHNTSVNKETATDKSTDSTAAVYEKSDKTQAASDTKKAAAPNRALADKLKADAESRKSQLQNIVNKIISGQGQAFDIANGKNLKNHFAGLAVDAKTRAQAQADIAEDGYWGVTQTSQRIFDFAMALSGGDPDKMEEMRSAFEKGFKKATRAWGDKLPDISHRTYDAVQSLFDDYKEKNAKSVDDGTDHT